MNKDLCNRLIQFAETVPEWRRFNKIKGGREYRFDQYWLLPTDSVYNETMIDALQTVPSAHKYFIQMRLSRYVPGDFIDSHADNAIPNRKVTAIIQLSDPSTYEGGDLVFADGTKASREQGSFVVFDSQTVWHAVSEITHGTRYSMVYWCYDGRPQAMPSTDKQ